MNVASWTQIEIASFTVFAIGIVLQFPAPAARRRARLVDLLLATSVAMMGIHFAEDGRLSIVIFGGALTLVGGAVAVLCVRALHFKSMREPRSQAGRYSIVASIVAGFAFDALMHTSGFAGCSAAGGSTFTCALSALA